MARPFLIHPLLILLVLLQFSTFMMLTCSATRKFDHKSDSIRKMYIKTSCGNTTYPRLCYISLAHHARKIKADPKLLAQAALNTTVYAAKATSKMLKEMSRIHGLKRNEAAAMLDCIADVRDAMQELEKSTREMDVIEGTDVQTKMNDVQMWVNTALEEEETCMNALFSSKAIKGKVKNRVRRHILKVAHLTGNALALVKSYAFLAQNNST